SPAWLQQKLKSIRMRPINNIVDITKFILHETGQPLHAYDAIALKGNKVIVKNLPAGSAFTTLDEKERMLNAEDLMICNGDGEGMCIAGVFGGSKSGVSKDTKDIFLESAWFNPIDIRKTSFRLGLRTDAATRFEKNTDISNTVNVLKRAATLIVEVAGGEIGSDVIDVYPGDRPKTQVNLKFNFLKKLSGKSYHSDAVKKILVSLGFEILREGADDILLAVPFSKPDISMQADVVEEIMRIDGLDNIEIPSSITISPSTETFGYKHTWKEKVANYLAGLGFNEIFTNSITNAAYFGEAELAQSVRLLNNLSADHNIMRPSMLETGLESVAYNLNRKNSNLRFFEFGKTYSVIAPGKYQETERLCLYITGNTSEDAWKSKKQSSDFYYLKGVVSNLLQLTGVTKIELTSFNNSKLDQGLQLTRGREKLGELGIVHQQELKRFDIRQPVYYADFLWEELLKMIPGKGVSVSELPKQLPVHRDLAMVVPSSLVYGDVEKTVRGVRNDKLTSVQLFDIFESEKLGKDKKSLAVSFTFLDSDKTLTDKEIDSMMMGIMTALEKQLGAEIRKQ
ncbi:MAG: phenylalanine--tRNA ligase subunit beta, partial [Chitinophagaceae bacterium]|nr:phenylalanine--tRNA ligase subunit beta [Chitinophagaceae bacterium]